MGTGQWSDQGLASKKRPVKNVGRHNMHHTILRLLATHTRGGGRADLAGEDSAVATGWQKVAVVPHCWRLRESRPLELTGNQPLVCWGESCSQGDVSLGSLCYKTTWGSCGEKLRAAVRGGRALGSCAPCRAQLRIQERNDGLPQRLSSALYWQSFSASRRLI